MSELTLPAHAEVTASDLEIQHKGTIRIECPLEVKKLVSREGSVFFSVPEGNIQCQEIQALSGLVALRAKKIRVRSLQAQEVHLQADDLQVQQLLQAKGRLHLECRSFSAPDLTAKEVILELEGDLHLKTLNVEGAVKLKARSIRLESLRVGSLEVETEDRFECAQMISDTDVVIKKGAISAQYLDCRSFQTEPGVSGIVMVSTAEDVRAEGVRGFIKPQEFETLAGLSKMPLLKTPPGSLEEKGNSKDQESPETSDFSQDQDLTDLTGGPTLDSQESFGVLEEQDEDEILDTLSDEEEFTEVESLSSDPAVNTSEWTSPEIPDELDSIQLHDHELLNEDPSFEEGPTLQGEAFDTLDQSLEEGSPDDDAQDAELIEDQEGSDTPALDQGYDSLLMEDDGFEVDLDEGMTPGEVSLDDLEHFDMDQGESDPSFEEVDPQKEGAAMEPGEFELNALPGETEAFPTQDFERELPEDEFQTKELTFSGLELSAEPHFSALQDQPGMDSWETVPQTEDELWMQLMDLYDAICQLFPEDDVPKFLDQIKAIIDGRKFSMLYKQKNREAVISRFEKLGNEQLNQLVTRMFAQLDAFYD
jgi:hypothetical protein